MKTNIRKLRQEACFTQKQLAALLDVKQNTVSYWEQDKTTPDNDTIAKIADLFHVTTGYVLGEEDERPNPRIIGNNLKHLMNQNGTSAEKVCSDLNFNRSDFDNWIEGKEIPDTESFKKLQDYFWASQTFLVNAHNFNKTSNSDSETKPDFMARYLQEREAQKIDSDRRKPKLVEILLKRKNVASDQKELIDCIPQLIEETESLASSLRMIAIAVNLDEADAIYKMPNNELVSKMFAYMNTHEKELNADQVRAFHKITDNYALFLSNVLHSLREPE